MKNFIIKLLATGFGLGYSPLVPGTAGSLLGILIFLGLIQINLPLIVYVGIIIGIFFLGVAVSTEAEKLYGSKDPKQIVIDEVAGCLVFLSLAPKWCLFSGFISPPLWYIIIGFVVYRLLDIIKPFPAARWQLLRGGWGVMMDDLVAGIYTGGIIYIGIWIWKMI